MFWRKKNTSFFVRSGDSEKVCWVCFCLCSSTLVQYSSFPPICRALLQPVVSLPCFLPESACCHPLSPTSFFFISYGLACSVPAVFIDNSYLIFLLPLCQSIWSSSTFGAVPSIYLGLYLYQLLIVGDTASWYLTRVLSFLACVPMRLVAFITALK